MQQRELRTVPGKVLLSWRAKSRPFNPVDSQSRSVLAVLMILVSIVLAFTGDWMILLVLAAGAFFYYAWNNTPPEELDFSITENGIGAFGRIYAWWEFNSWWLTSKAKTDLLGLELNSGVLARIYVPLEGVKLEDVKKVVEKHLPYDEPKDTLLDKLGKWLIVKFPLGHEQK